MLFNFKFKPFTVVLLLLATCTFAQTGIGTTTPNASAKLDVYSDNKGFLPPRVTLTSATDNTTVPSPAEGLLVYNKGSVGLQAGYYYWNGANWATIATATSAGNGVTATNMVNLYSKAYSSAVGDIADVNGYSFTVPVSGRYLFDFSCSAFTSNTTFTMYFKVRQGTTDISTDLQTSSNNSAHVEYNGKVEANLQAGVTYNVYVTGGSRNSNDYDRVYMKLVAGNLPVTGQSVDYGIARYTGADGSSLTNGAIVGFDATAVGNLTWSGNKFTLKANRTYEIESGLSIFHGSSAGVAGRFQIYDYTNSNPLANSLFMSQNGAGTYAQSANTPMKCIITPTTDIQVGVRMLDFYGPATGPGIIGNAVQTGSSSSPNASYFMVKQIGSSAIVNPWTLSGTNTYNITGNVGIGTSTPNASAILDISSSSKGVLPPKVVLTGRNGTSSPIASPTTGLFVYNTADAGTASNEVSPGFYFYNGTNWTRMDPEDWSIPVSITIGAVTTAPTKGTIVYDKVTYRRTSTTSYEVTYNYSQSAVGAAGSGDYLFRLPGNLTFGSSILKTSSSSYETIVNRAIIGNGYYGDTSGRLRPIGIIPYDNTRFRIMVMDNTLSGLIVGSSTLGLNTDGASYKFSIILETN